MASSEARLMSMAEGSAPVSKMTLSGRSAQAALISAISSQSVS